MKSLASILIVLYACVLSLLPVSALEEAPAAPPAETQNKFTSRVQGILDHTCLKKENIGLQIVSLDQNDTLFALNDGDLFSPASNVKLITTAAALKFLGPDYRFNTTLYTDGRRKGNTLEGHLYLKGGGDPFLVSEEVWLMAKDLKNLGIRRVTGDFVVDDSYFDDDRIGNGWGKNPGAQAYNARIGATSLNFNTVTVYVSPGETVGSPPEVVIDPPTAYIKVENTATTTDKRGRKRLIINRVPGEGRDVITITGNIASTAGRERYLLNVTNPLFFAASAFREFLEEAGIHVEGKTRYEPAPPKAVELVNHESKPLAFIVRGLNKYSNNFTAEQLLKSMGAVASGPPGSFAKGLGQVHSYLAGLGITKESYVLEDGSGLSRLNRVMPRHLVAILKDVYGDFKIRPEYMASLSIMGVDGSVQRRMGDLDSVRYRTRVKTGTLNGVNALSGYVSAKNGEALAFSMLMNYKNGCYPRKVLDLQDEIVKAMTEFER